MLENLRMEGIMRKLFLLLACIGLLAAACSTADQSTAASTTGGAALENTPISFQPLPDGFGFRNYGIGFPEGNLTIDEVRRLFGDRVCARLEGGTCIPTPAAQLWIDTLNRYMESGHCEGFTVLSYRFFTGQLEQADFETNADTTYDLLQQAPLMKEIALNFTYQTLEEVWRTTVEGTPKEIVGALQSVAWPVNVGIFSTTGSGHSLLAYGMESLGNGIYHILAYDNNAPGQDVIIEVDVNADTWKYLPAELTPDGQAEDWRGDAESFTLDFTPLSAYDQPVACPFCPAQGSASKSGQQLAAPLPQAAKTNYMYITLAGSSTIDITNTAGQRIAVSGGAAINEIPETKLLRLHGGLAGDGVIIALPQREPQNLTILLPGVETAGNVSLRAYSSDLTYVVDGLDLQEGQMEQVGISTEERSVRYTAGGYQQPAIKLTFQREGESYLLLVNNADMQAGESLTMALDPQTELLTIHAEHLQDPLIGLAFARVDGEGAQIFANNAINISPDGTATLDILHWKGEKSLNETIDSESDGKTVLQVGLQDQPLVSTFSSEYTADDILNSYKEFAPYLDGSEQEPMPYILASYGFDGSDLGRIFHAFDDFGMPPQAVADYLSVTLACPWNISMFLLRQQLPADGPGSMEEWIPLFPEEYSQYIPSFVAELKVKNDALIEGTFQGLSGEVLNGFMETYIAEHTPPK
jgi:hypothetical protein